ncbi:tetratricopeptide repeat protein [Raineya orbicola]|uniref:Tetratricopeptide repeat n=1 Tax=Raineya orbicola TaxID=2016530 RepID=A0A2N3IJH7_9BACT|nr:tetratricopeptide repeat protein [Raineya orbicola]PKQ70421.1 Tetratricopeptide repeat [Raineya orbicola]
MAKRLIITLFQFIVFSLEAQNLSKIDSLQNILPNATPPNQVQILLQLNDELLGFDTEKSIKYAQEALLKAQNIQDKVLLASAHTSLANAYLQRSENKDIQEAYKNYTQALNLLEKNSSSEAEKAKAKVLSGLANVYFQWGEYKEASLLNLESLKLREKYQDDYGKARCYNTAGIIYDALGDYKQAVVEYTKALNIYEKLKKMREIAGVLDNLASSLKLQLQTSENASPDFSQIIDYYNRSLKISEDLQDHLAISRTLNNLGILAQSQKDYEKAQKYYEKSLESAVLCKEKQGLANTYANLARLYGEKEQWNDALRFYEKALEIADEAQAKQELFLIFRERSKIYAQKGDFQNAYTDLLASNVLEKQLNDLENLRVINNLTSKYEVEKYKKEIEKLRYEAIISEQENQIFWGFAGFIIFLAAVSAFFYYRQSQLKEKLNQANKAKLS